MSKKVSFTIRFEYAVQLLATGHMNCPAIPSMKKEGFPHENSTILTVKRTPHYSHVNDELARQRQSKTAL